MRAMIDIESFDTGPNAHVASVGVCVFDHERVVDSRYWAMNREDQGGTFNADTVMWWMSQGNEARAAIVDFQKTPFKEALTQLNDFFTYKYLVSTVWAKPPTFDLVILGNLYRRNKMTPKWHYRDERCLRTLMKVAEANGIPPFIQEDVHGTAHNALDDAISQANSLLRIEKALKVVVG